MEEQPVRSSLPSWPTAVQAVGAAAVAPPRPPPRAAVEGNPRFALRRAVSLQKSSHARAALGAETRPHHSTRHQYRHSVRTVPYGSTSTKNPTVKRVQRETLHGGESLSSTAAASRRDTMPTILVMELTARAVSAGSAVDLTHAPKAGTTPPHHRPCQFTDRLIFDPFFNAGATPERLSVETASTQHHDTLSLADIRREIAAVHSSLISTAEANADATPLSELLKTRIVDLADADLRTQPGSQLAECDCPTATASKARPIGK